MPVELRPGESATVIVHLLRDWPRNARTPGKYTARVVFESGKVRAVSTAAFDLEVVK